MVERGCRVAVAGRLIAVSDFQLQASDKAAAQKAYGDPSTAENDDQKDSYVWAWSAKKVQIQLSFNKAKSSASLHIERDK